MHPCGHIRNNGQSIWHIKLVISGRDLSTDGAEHESNGVPLFNMLCCMPRVDQRSNRVTLFSFINRCSPDRERSIRFTKSTLCQTLNIVLLILLLSLYVSSVKMTLWFLNFILRIYCGRDIQFPLNLHILPPPPVFLRGFLFFIFMLVIWYNNFWLFFFYNKYIFPLL